MINNVNLEAIILTPKARQSILKAALCRTEEPAYALLARPRGVGPGYRSVPRSVRKKGGLALNANAPITSLSESQRVHQNIDQSAI